MPWRLRIKAPAKLNLFLHITGKRADGYHSLQSLVVFLDVGDTLEARPDKDITLSLHGAFAAGLGTEDNLVMRAATLLRQHNTTSSGAAMRLGKNIPIGAGLGGGSADAAATIRLLCNMWKLDLTPEALHTLALRLGSDIPACLSSTPAVLSGIGEEIRPVHITAHPFMVLANPQKPLLTADVYRAYCGHFRTDIQVPDTLDMQTLLALLHATHNDLETPAITLMPQIHDILQQIKTQPGCRVARMSGSGATCFGIFESEDMAEEAAHALQRRQPGWWVKCATISTHPG